jgi:hypothetical protein
MLFNFLKRKKVYCRNCKEFLEGIYTNYCEVTYKKVKKGTYKVPPLVQELRSNPAKKNKWNNCKDYKDKAK